MDMWALIITAVSVVLYFVSKKKPIFILTTGVGLGMLIGAVWAYSIVSSILP